MGEQVIYKYPFITTDTFVVETLDGPILHVGLDCDGTNCMWVQGEVGTVKRRRMMIVGTGNAFEADGWTWRGTWLEEPFVWHLFEKDPGGHQ